MTDGIDDTDGAKRDSSFGEPTRRAALGAGAAAALSGLAGCAALDRLFDGSDGSAPADGGADEPDGETDDGDRGGNGGREPLWKAERERRRTVLEEPSPSFVPSYEYDPIDVTADEGTSGEIDRIVAAPAESAPGDRIVVSCRPERAERLSKLSSLLWTAETRVDGYETTVDGQSVEFDLFADEATAVGLGTTDTDDSAELLVARADDVTAVETLIETFSDVYDRV